MINRHPAGTSAGGRFATAPRSRAEVEISEPGAGTAGEAEYFKALERYRSRAAQFDALAHGNAPLSEHLAAMQARSVAYRSLNEAAQGIGITPPVRPPADPGELTAAEDAHRRMREAVDAIADDPEASAHRLRQLLSSLGESDFRARAARMAKAARACALFDSDPDAAYHLTGPGADPEGFLDDVDLDAHRDDDGYDFETLRSELADDWATRLHQELRDAHDADWASRAPA